MKGIIFGSVFAAAFLSGCALKASQPQLPQIILVQNPDSQGALYIDGQKVAEGKGLEAMGLRAPPSQLSLERLKRDPDDEPKPKPEPKPLPTPDPTPCGDIRCPRPDDPKPPPPTCHGPFCPGGTPLLGRNPQLIIWKNDRFGELKDRFNVQEMPLKLQRFVEQR